MSDRGEAPRSGDSAASASGQKRPLPPRDVQSMGWLTESSQQPKRHRYIEGVGGRGLPEMQAQLYKLEQQAAAKKASGQSLSKPRRVPAGALGASNSGVDTRNQKDLRDAPTDANRLAASEAALEWKAQLYAKLACGEEVSAEDDSYNVDFFAKAGERPLPDADALTAAANAPQSRLGIGASRPSGNEGGGAGEREQWERDERHTYEAQSAEEERRDRRVDAVFELERETEEGRRRAAETKDRRKSREDQKRAALKAAMVKQVAAKLMKAKQAGSKSSGAA